MQIEFAIEKMLTDVVAAVRCQAEGGDILVVGGGVMRP